MHGSFFFLTDCVAVELVTQVLDQGRPNFSCKFDKFARKRQQDAGDLLIIDFNRYEVTSDTTGTLVFSAPDPKLSSLQHNLVNSSFTNVLE